MWENSREFSSIGSSIARNRKVLLDRLQKFSASSSTVSFEVAKKILEDMINQHFQGLSDEKLKCVLRVAEIQGSGAVSESLYEFGKLLEVYKQRHAGAQM